MKIGTKIYPRYFKTTEFEGNKSIFGHILYRVQYHPNEEIYRIFDNGRKDESYWGIDRIEKAFEEIPAAEAALLS